VNVATWDTTAKISTTSSKDGFDGSEEDQLLVGAI